MRAPDAAPGECDAQHNNESSDRSLHHRLLSLGWVDIFWSPQHQVGALADSWPTYNSSPGVPDVRSSTRMDPMANTSQKSPVLSARR
jgi:hypothetical protein